MSLTSGSKFGPYEIQSPLGAGGMGEVYSATQSSLGRQVAIKVLASASALDPERLRRFEQEARAASALNHPNIISIYDVGRENSTAYIAMELVDGKTLRALLEAGPIPIKRTLHIATQIADGLAKAHAAGIVHRDLKPENVMVSRDGFVKILDFGLAKLLEDEAPRLTSEAGDLLTRPGTIVGTASYMSPEQARGELVDFRSDQFAFGAVLYEMLTGARARRRLRGAGRRRRRASPRASQGSGAAFPPRPHVLGARPLAERLEGRAAPRVHVRARVAPAHLAEAARGR